MTYPSFIHPDSKNTTYVAPNDRDEDIAPESQHRDLDDEALIETDEHVGLHEADADERGADVEEDDVEEDDPENVGDEAAVAADAPPDETTAAVPEDRAISQDAADSEDAARSDVDADVNADPDVDADAVSADPDVDANDVATEPVVVVDVVDEDNCAGPVAHEQVVNGETAIDGRIVEPIAPSGDMRPGDAPMPGSAAVSPAAQAALQERWQQAQLGFIDDPHGSTEAARAIAVEALEAHITALQARQAELDSWQQDAAPDTEILRSAMRGYRDLVTSFTEA